MSKGKSSDSDKDFLARLERVSDEIPVTEAEAEILLQDSGIDASKGLARLLGRVEAFDAQYKKTHYAQIDAARRAALARVPTQTPARQQSRVELLTRLKALRTNAEQPQAYFRSLESMPDDDLASLIAQLEELSSRGRKE